MRIPRIKNTNFLRYHFYVNTNIQGDFHICISVPLNRLKSLVTIRMNEIFPCISCDGQELNFCSEIEIKMNIKINVSSVKGSGEDEIGTIFLKIDIYDLS